MAPIDSRGLPAGNIPEAGQIGGCTSASKACDAAAGNDPELGQIGRCQHPIAKHGMLLQALIACTAHTCKIISQNHALASVHDLNASSAAPAKDHFLTPGQGRLLFQGAA